MIDHFRKTNRMEGYEPLRHGEDLVDTQYSDLGEVLTKAVMQLPVDQRAVVMLRDYEGYSYKEIGEITGLSESQVKVYIFRARIYLKKYLVKMEYVV
jgi:RNA polymerase sigma-70 factor (ECF subfamily)